MKEIKSTVFALLMIASTVIVMSACNKPEINTKKVNNSSTSNYTPMAKWSHLYYAEWEEWGRAAKNCASWGLCYFEHCAFCNPEDLTAEHTAKIMIDTTTNEGIMTIELDPSDPQSADAIADQLDFYIDEDIVSEELTLIADEYPFNSNIGEYGGYEVRVTRQE